MSETQSIQTPDAEVETNSIDVVKTESGKKIVVDGITGEKPSEVIKKIAEETRTSVKPGSVRAVWDAESGLGIEGKGDLVTSSAGITEEELWEFVNKKGVPPIPLSRKLAFILSPDAREVDVVINKEPQGEPLEKRTEKDTNARIEYADLDTEIKSVNKRGEKDPQKDLDIATDKVLSWYMLGRRHQIDSPLPKGYEIREIEKGVIEIYNPDNKGVSVFIKYKTEFWPTGVFRRHTAKKFAVRLQNPNNSEEYLDIMPQKGTPDYNEQMGMVLGVMRPNLNTNDEQSTQPPAEPEDVEDVEDTEDTVKTETDEVVDNGKGEIKKLQEQLAQLEIIMGELENSIQGVEKKIIDLRREEKISKSIIRALKKRLKIYEEEADKLQTGYVSQDTPNSPGGVSSATVKTTTKVGGEATSEEPMNQKDEVAGGNINTPILERARKVLKEGGTLGKLDREQIKRLTQIIKLADSNTLDAVTRDAATNYLNQLQNKISS